MSILIIIIGSILTAFGLLIMTSSILIGSIPVALGVILIILGVTHKRKPSKKQSEPYNNLAAPPEMSAVPSKTEKGPDRIENYDFVAIDFETATEQLNSACQVGIAAVKDLDTVDTFQFYIRPPDNCYSERNIKIHGISPEATHSAPSMDELWPTIKRFFSPHTPVIAHNAHFDMSVLRLSYQGEIPDFWYVDTMQVVQVLDLPSRSLEACCNALEIPLDAHHDALCDARATAGIFLKFLEAVKCKSAWEALTFATWIEPKRFSDLNPQIQMGSGKNKSKPATPSVKPSEIQPTVEPERNHPLFGRTIVFTGELSIPREQAFQLAVNCGAIIRTSVSRKTDFLIVGEQNGAIVGKDGLSTKQRTAITLNKEGQANIQIYNEEEFFNLINGE